MTLARKTVKPGQTETITVRTLPSAQVKFVLTITHPAKVATKAATTRRHTAIADAQGIARWKIKVGHHLATPATGTVKVTVTSQTSSTPLTVQRRFTVPRG